MQKMSVVAEIFGETKNYTYICTTKKRGIPNLVALIL